MLSKSQWYSAKSLVLNQVHQKEHGSEMVDEFAQITIKEELNGRLLGSHIEDKGANGKDQGGGTYLPSFRRRQVC